MDSSEYITKLFEKAGWSKGRIVDFQPAVRPENRAEEIAFDILHEYGSLAVGETGTGRECAASDIRFLSGPCRGKIVAVQRWLDKTGDLAAIADAHNDHMIVYVGCDGNCFIYTDPDEKLYSCGLPFADTTTHLLLGTKIGPGELGVEV